MLRHTRYKYFLPLILLCIYIAAVHCCFSQNQQRCYEAAVASDRGEQFACVWSYRSLGNGVIEGASIRKFERERFRTFTISDSAPDVNDLYPALCWTRGKIFVAWQREQRGISRIVGRFFSSDGKALSSVLPISDTTHRRIVMRPSVQANSEGSLLVAWQDYRNGSADIYAQLLDSTLHPLGSNQMLNDDQHDALQGVPKISKNNATEYATIWIDKRSDSIAYFFQRFSMQPEGRNVLLDSVQPKDLTMTAASTWCSDRRIRFVWKDYREGNGNIFSKQYDVLSSTSSKTEKINDDAGSKWQRLPDIDRDAKDRTIICWEDYRNTERNQQGDVYMQALGSTGKRVGKNVRVNDGSDRRARYNPSIAMNSAGDALIVWHQAERGLIEIVGTWISFPTTRRGKNFRISVRE